MVRFADRLSEATMNEFCIERQHRLGDLEISRAVPLSRTCQLAIAPC